MRIPRNCICWVSIEQPSVSNVVAPVLKHSRVCVECAHFEGLQPDGTSTVMKVVCLVLIANIVCEVLRRVVVH